MQRDSGEIPGRRTRKRPGRRPFEVVSRAGAILVCCAALFLSGFMLGLHREGSFKTASIPTPSEQVVVISKGSPSAPGGTPDTSGSTRGPEEPDVAPPTSEELLSSLKWPVEGRIAREPGWIYSEPLKEWLYFPGVDIAAEPGSAVKAAIRGVVKSVFTDPVMGMVLVVRHEGGLETAYGRIASTTKAPGDNVAQGAVIGTSGPDGVYFRIACDEEPLNPQDYLAKAK